MTDVQGLNVTDMMTAKDSTTDHNHATDFTLNPGYTTLISFSVAIVLVVAYLYYDNAMQCVKTACLKRRPPDKDVEDCVEGTDVPQSNGVSSNGNNAHGLLPKIAEEPGVLCECGQVHLLKDCVKEVELKPYRDALNRITSSRESQGTNKCDVVDETSNYSKTDTNWVPITGDDDRTPDGPKVQKSTSPSEAQCDSGGSSPRCATPLIQVKTAKAPGAPIILYSYSGARPKEYTTKKEVS